MVFITVSLRFPKSSLAVCIPIFLYYRPSHAYPMSRFVAQFILPPLFAATLGAEEAPLDYARDILPILSHNCFDCHGPDENSREAGRRLDTAEGAYADLEGIVAIAPGDPDASEVIYLINTDYPEERMPPLDTKKSLSDAEKAILARWIEEGAQYDTHWAFEAPRKAEVSPSDHPVDTLVHKRLHEEGLQPSPPADAATLLRRLHLDLVGLPPTPSEILSFISQYETNPTESVESVVDDLLNRTEFGEKWARHWLDVARYADTNGFEKDKMRDQWIYREWVVDALNKDLPYDQFLVEQLAGDLLPNPTQDQIVATGFMRNGMVNEEGAIIPEEFRIKGIFDRMDAFGKATLGLTLQCAQCHSHKYDPISHEEYFGLFSFFNDTHEAQSWVYSDSQLETIGAIKHDVSELESRIKRDHPNWLEEIETWGAERVAENAIWKIWDTSLQIWEGGLNHPEELPDHSIIIQGHPTVVGMTTTEGVSNLPVVTGMRLEALTHGDQPFRGPGRSFWGTFAVSEWEVSYRLPGEEKWKKAKLKEATTDFDFEDSELHPYFENKKIDAENLRRIGPVANLIDGDDKTGWSPDRGPVLRHTASVAAVQFETPLETPEGTEIRVQLKQRHGGDNNGRDNLQVGRYRFALTDAESPSVPPIDHAAILALQTPREKRTSKQSDAIFRAWRKSRADLESINSEIAAREAEYPEAKTSVLHTMDTQPQFKRVTQLLDKGAWDKPTEVVARSVPAVLNPMTSENPTRLDLARWVTRDDAPLTARVQVNRIWQALFGEGLVITPEDFGTRAPIPEYQDLLDWLAVDFLENDWSQKALIKTIVSSKTYQQRSQLTDELREKDPRNRLLSRGPRFRAEAEVVRDIALSASGLLTSKLGGPSIFPPIPETVLKDNYVVPEYWKETTSKNRYRRSLYVFRKRAMPDPTLSAFDAPNADISCVQRGRTNSPLSALTSLNEPIFVESAKALALRILEEGGSDDRSRVNYGYLLTTGRPARDNEIDEIVALMDGQQSRLADGWLNSQSIAFIDIDNPPELPEGVSPRTVAAWAIASRVLLNLDETLTKN